MTKLKIAILPKTFPFCRWIWSTCTRSPATTLSPWASTSQSSTSASSETLFQKLQRAERKMWCHWISPQHWVGLWVAGCKIKIGRFLFSFCSKQAGYTFSRWDILDVPATKNVELYNPEMDESKPKSEVPWKYFFGGFSFHIFDIMEAFCQLFATLKHWEHWIDIFLFWYIWSQVDAENDKLLTDITFILTMRRKTLFYTVTRIWT